MALLLNLIGLCENEIADSAQPRKHPDLFPRERVGSGDETSKELQTMLLGRAYGKSCLGLQKLTTETTQSD